MKNSVFLLFAAGIVFTGFLPKLEMSVTYMLFACCKYIVYVLNKNFYYKTYICILILKVHLKHDVFVKIKQKKFIGPIFWLRLCYT